MKKTWLLLFWLVLFSTHIYGRSQLVTTRSLTKTHVLLNKINGQFFYSHLLNIWFEIPSKKSNQIIEWIISKVFTYFLNSYFLYHRTIIYGSKTSQLYKKDSLLANRHSWVLNAKDNLDVLYYMGSKGHHQSHTCCRVILIWLDYFGG